MTKKAESYGIRLRMPREKFDTKLDFTDDEVTGRQILERFDLRPAEEYVLLAHERDGTLEPVGLEKAICLHGKGPETFFASKADGSKNFMINGRRFPWGDDKISVELVRELGNIPGEHNLYLERHDEADRRLMDDESIDLSGPSLECMYSTQEFKLEVQGVMCAFDTPKVLVKDALVEAGLSPERGWIVTLYHGGGKELEVDLEYEIDLSQPGIEVLGAIPKTVTDGGTSPEPRREFSLLPRDEEFLEQRKLQWETIVEENGQRWLILRRFPLPKGFDHPNTDIAILVPLNYPDAPLDMFYCLPPLKLAGNREISGTDGSAEIEGQKFQRWSRHITDWNPETDGVSTHMTVIDGCLAQEARR